MRCCPDNRRFRHRCTRHRHRHRCPRPNPYHPSLLSTCRRGRRCRCSFRRSRLRHCCSCMRCCPDNRRFRHRCTRHRHRHRCPRPTPYHPSLLSTCRRGRRRRCSFRRSRLRHCCSCMRYCPGNPRFHRHRRRRRCRRRCRQRFPFQSRLNRYHSLRALHTPHLLGQHSCRPRCRSNCLRCRRCHRRRCLCW